VTDVFIEFTYYLYREETAQCCTFVGIGCAKGMPRQTLNVIEGASRDFIAEEFDWDTRTTVVHISIYEV